MTAPENHTRVRFAPSPTGSLHVGGVRTALFNWLFARGKGGEFILRIEDTDRKRSRKELSDEIIRELDWLGLDWDGEPVFQSERFDLYRSHAERLFREGKAYRSDPDKPGAGAIILQVAPAAITFRDLVYGSITVSGTELKDIVLLKSDGSPAYNFACAVDDHEMGITHVIRGDDHLPNTPKQIILYRALEWSLPLFAHLPLILGADKTPLSKRHGSTSLRAFREDGILPDALKNYLALLGWSPGDNRELLSVDDLLKEFSLKKVSRKSAVFDFQKLLWLNGQYILQTPAAELVRRLRPLLAGTVWETVSPERLHTIVKLLGHRLKSLKDFLPQADYFIGEQIAYDPEAVARYWTEDGVGTLLAEVRESLAAVEHFTEEELEKALRGIISRRGIKGGTLIHPLRIALTGRKDSPGIFEIMVLLGREAVLKRLDNALTYLEKNQGEITEKKSENPESNREGIRKSGDQ